MEYRDNRKNWEDFSNIGGVSKQLPDTIHEWSMTGWKS